MDLNKAPEQGMLYALYTDEVKYKKYERKALFQEENLERNLLELHLFDDVKEYRYIKTRNGEIEEVISDVHDAEYYCEKIVTLGNKKEKPDEDSTYVKVINYLKYDENDFIKIENYRLKEVR